jgi:aminoglycoside 2'-N-acetyltransferase I
MHTECAQLCLRVVSSEALSQADRHAIVDLCNRAYEEDLMSPFDTFGAATHVLAYFADDLVSHAMWVTRWLQAGTGPLMCTAYIEMVATDQAYRNRGFATAVMKRMADEIATFSNSAARETQHFDLAALSPFSVAYYARLGWERWRGPLFIRTDEGLLPSPEDEVVMILRLSNTPALDLDAPLSAEWRKGELW